MKRHALLALLTIFSALLSCIPLAQAANDNALVVEVAKQAATTPDLAQKQVDIVFAALRAELQAGREVTIKNFGRFHVETAKEREVRNPRTGDKLRIDARRYPRFTSSDTFKDEMNPHKTATKIEADPSTQINKAG